MRDHLGDSSIPARVQAGATVAHVFLDEAADLARAEASLRNLRHVSVYRGDALPESLRLRHPTRTGDLVVIAEPGYVFRGTSWGQRAWRQLAGLFGYSTGLHG